MIEKAAKRSIIRRVPVLFIDTVGYGNLRQSMAGPFFSQTIK